MTKSPQNREFPLGTTSRVIGEAECHQRNGRPHGNWGEKGLSYEEFDESGYVGSLLAADIGNHASAHILPPDSPLINKENGYSNDWEIQNLNSSKESPRTIQQDGVHNLAGSAGSIHSFRNGINFLTDVRSLSLSSSICSDGSSLEGDITNEHTRLTAVINNIDPKRLHNYLKRKLKQRDNGTIAALGALLPKKKFKGETLHCVRCHKEYDPRHGDKKCELFHRRDDVMKISEDELGADFACERCGSVFRLDGKWKYKESSNKKHKCGACFTGVHTVSTDEVQYEPQGLSKTCEDYGCIVFYV